MKRENIIDGTKKGQTLPVDNLVVMQVLAAQEDLDYYKVTIIVSDGVNEPIVGEIQGGSIN